MGPGPSNVHYRVLRAMSLEFALDQVYGADAERMAKNIFKYYDDKAPILKKYLT